MASNNEVIVFTLRGSIAGVPQVTAQAGVPQSLASKTEVLNQATEAEIRSILGEGVTVTCLLDFPPSNTMLRGSVIFNVGERGLSYSVRRALPDTIKAALASVFNADQDVAANFRLTVVHAFPANLGALPSEPARNRPPMRERRGIGLVVSLLIGIAVSDVQWLVARSEKADAATSSVVSNADASTGPMRSATDLQALYARSIEEAAVHTPDMRVTLRPIVDDPVRVVSFSSRSPLEQEKTRNYTWVSQAVDLIAFCKRAADPLLTVQQTLGLPPSQSVEDMQAMRAYVMIVRKADIFRPCVSSTDTGTTSCEVNAPDFRAATQADSEERRMVMWQLWKAHKSGFGDPGYPFTGMGWTYNWNPSSRDHIGVSEYVVRPGASVEKMQAMTPADFCSATF
ncbi:hypothetical protein BSFA1_63830 (plasmid) [Burkholderia sp. SFA1]|nr:hypothetical protein BSFA1_63830 [Burkholderia sp. SFA1]